MVDFTEAQLDRAFAALADPTRRAILDRLAREEGLAVTEIAGRFAVSLPAVMKHLDVLARAGLDRAREDRANRALPPRAAPMETAMQWLPRYERFWTERAGCAGQIRGGGLMLKPQSQASPSSASSKPAGGQVFAAWTDPEKIVHWFGPARRGAGSVRAEMDVRVGGRYRIRFKTEDGEQPRGRRRLSRGGAQQPAGLQLGLAFDAGARVARHRHGEPRTATARMLTLHHEQFFDEKARDGHNARLDRHA